MSQWACWLGKWLLLALPPTASPESDVVDRPTTPAAIAAPDGDPPLSQAELRELEQIRRRVGRNPLRGTILEQVQLPEFSDSAGADFANQLRTDYAAEPPDSTEPVATPAAYRRRGLRSLRRRLENIALDLEELEMARDADRVRDLKNSLDRAGN